MALGELKPESVKNDEKKRIYDPIMRCIQEKIVEPFEKGSLNPLAIGESPCKGFTDVLESEMKGEKDGLRKLMFSIEKRQDMILKEPSLLPCRSILEKRFFDQRNEGAHSEKIEIDTYNCLVPIRCPVAWGKSLECLKKTGNVYSSCHNELMELYDCILESALLESKKEYELIRKLM